MSDTFGLSSRTPFAFFDPDSSSLRMSQATFLSDSMSSSVTLPPSGLMRGGVLYALPMSAPATDEPGSSSLPTPTAGDAKSSRNATAGRSDPDSKHHAGVTLTDMVALLPTPVAHDDGKSPVAHMAMKGRMPGGPRDQITSLSVMARQAGEMGRWDSALLPTPTSRDHKGRNQRDDETCLPGAVGNLLPTPEASDGTGGRRSKELGGKRPSGAKRAISLATALDHRSTGASTEPPSSDTSKCSVEQLRIL